MSKTKERPIILSAEEVRAVIAGEKTQHRIPLAAQPHVNEFGDQVLTLGGVRITDACAAHVDFNRAIKENLPKTDAKPYQMGDLLWAQEAHQPIGWSFDDGEVTLQYLDGSKRCLNYQTEEEIESNPNDDYLIEICDQLIARGVPIKEGTEKFDMSDVRNLPHWRGGPDMPRWASRVTVEVIGIRVERLKEITENDAKQEGLKRPQHLPEHYNQRHSFSNALGGYTSPYKADFFDLWTAKHGYKGHYENPWVWVIEFKKVSE